MSDSLWPHEPQHARLPCPSPTPRAAQTHVHRVGDAMQPLHPLSSLLLLPSIFSSTRGFSKESVLCIRWPKYWSFSFSISQNWFPSGLTDLISLQSKGLSRVFSNSHIHTWLLKNHSFDYYKDLCWQSDVSVFNTLSRFVIAFFPRSKCVLISRSHNLQWFWSPRK